MIKCQRCEKDLEGRFEEERQLCHLCFVNLQIEEEKRLQTSGGKNE